jgi:hypothetical protein
MIVLDCDGCPGLTRDVQVKVGWVMLLCDE